MNWHFSYADKSDLPSLLPPLFEILYANMTLIVPTGCTYEEDYQTWFSYVYPAMQKPQRQIVVMYAGDSIIGYFQYDIRNETLMMEEIQIKKPYHGSGVFSAFYAWLVRQLPDDIKTVEAYSNKKNIKSQSVLEHLGLTRCGENKNGNSYYYRGDYKTILERYGA